MAIVHGAKIKLFALSSNKELGKEIADVYRYALI
jgi:hypothetical protein